MIARLASGTLVEMADAVANYMIEGCSACGKQLITD